MRIVFSGFSLQSVKLEVCTTTGGFKLVVCYLPYFSNHVKVLYLVKIIASVSYWLLSVSEQVNKLAVNYKFISGFLNCLGLGYIKCS